MAAANDTPLDEIVWRHPGLANQMQGIHSNSVLFYFAQSPFFEITSNNSTIIRQGQTNPNMFYLIQTREAFEGRLREMSGLEFMVAQEPAEMGPGMGTGIWVIRKQTRRKREPEDDIVVHATYYVVGDMIFMAPSLADVLGFRMTTITTALSKCFPAADEARTWTPSTGHMYKTSPTATSLRTRAPGSKEATPAPESQGSKPGALEPRKLNQSAAVDSRLAEHSAMVHMQYGGDYMDENPITGKPGEFHLTSTGRKDKLQVPSISTTLSTSFKSTATAPTELGKKETSNKGDRTPKTPTGMSSKIKRKKSKSGQTPTSS